jgi:superfamily II DNA helicase RecQ
MVSATHAERLAEHVQEVFVTRPPLPSLANPIVRRMLAANDLTSLDAFTEIVEPLGAHLASELITKSAPAVVTIADPLRGRGLLAELVGSPTEVHIDELPARVDLRDQMTSVLTKHAQNRVVRHQLLHGAVTRLLDADQQLRDFQLAVIDDILEERDVVAVFRTGLGKSLCYQIPSLMLGAAGAVTVVISPLVALQRDQHDGLRKRGIFEAAIYNSQMSGELRAAVRRGLEAGFYTTIFLAPEALHGRAIARTLSKLDLALIVVDEAHCISEMGHDFRPDYRTLPTVIRRLLVLADNAPFPPSGERPTLLALTGTAGPQVIDDIRDQLT